MLAKTEFNPIHVTINYGNLEILSEYFSEGSVTLMICVFARSTQSNEFDTTPSRFLPFM